MKNTVLYAVLGIVLGMQATSAQALTYTVTTGNTSNVAGATTIDFGTSPVNNVTSTTGALPAGYTGGALFNTSTSGISGLAARPVGSTDNFWSIGGGVTGKVVFEAPASYFGFLWGSPDVGSWNRIKFYDGNALLASLDGSVISGGNAWTNSRYFNVYAGVGEKITSVVFSASQNAFETDNHAFITAVPEPESYALILAGLGLIGLGVRRRQQG